MPATIEAVRGRFGIENVVFVGDRGMITQAHAEALTEQGVDFISALKAPRIRKLLEAGDLQLGLFDERNLAEIASQEFPGERLVVCRNPAVAAERARKRAELLAATEAELEKVRAMVEGERGSLRKAAAGRIGERAGRVVNRFKVAKHFELRIDDASFSWPSFRCQACWLPSSRCQRAAAFPPSGVGARQLSQPILWGRQRRAGAPSSVPFLLGRRRRWASARPPPAAVKPAATSAGISAPGLAPQAGLLT